MIQQAADWAPATTSSGCATCASPQIGYATGNEFSPSTPAYGTQTQTNSVQATPWQPVEPSVQQPELDNDGVAPPAPIPADEVPSLNNGSASRTSYYESAPASIPVPHRTIYRPNDDRPLSNQMRSNDDSQASQVLPRLQPIPLPKNEEPWDFDDKLQLHGPQQRTARLPNKNRWKAVPMVLTSRSDDALRSPVTPPAPTRPLVDVDAGWESAHQ